MSVLINDKLAKKADELKKTLKHRKVFPVSSIEIRENPSAFQGLDAISISRSPLPVSFLPGDSIILDFGEHCVGYLNFSVNHIGRICDAPAGFRFTFGENLIELVKSPDDFCGTLSRGWLQIEEKYIPFMPYCVALERRYAFRYLRIERIDPKAGITIGLNDIFADCVSAVDVADVKIPAISDPELEKIYRISLKTLADCEQDVFEDGPKRDRRLWIGDLRLEAITDYVSFKNTDLVKRCIYLFAAYRWQDGFVAPYVFPDSPPFVDDNGWRLADYALFLTSCLLDFAEATGDLSLPNELYDIAKEQIYTVTNEDIQKSETIIDWCDILNKDISNLGVYIYVLKQFVRLSEIVGKSCDDIKEFVLKAETKLSGYFSEKQSLFVSGDGQISYHSQVWGVLSGIFSEDKNRMILKKISTVDSAVKIRSPYMMHSYIEALFENGLKNEAMEQIKKYWGEMVRLGFDCCPEVWNPENHFESPYNAPEINSACHAWSCTPAYWIYRYYNE